MAEAWGHFKHGLFFGCGFLCAYGLLKLLLWLINTLASGAHTSLPQM